VLFQLLRYDLKRVDNESALIINLKQKEIHVGLTTWIELKSKYWLIEIGPQQLKLQSIIYDVTVAYITE